MEMIIEEEKYNPFLKRKDLRILVKHEKEATPSKEKIKSFFKEKFNVDDSQIEIIYIVSKIGLAESIVKARIYDEKREVKKVEAQPSENKSGS
ncbi:MAG: hypothetical protein ACP5H3_00320 [Candidatus Aenigmatarchaeota archaeon]